MKSQRYELIMLLSVNRAKLNSIRILQFSPLVGRREIITKLGGEISTMANNWGKLIEKREMGDERPLLIPLTHNILAGNGILTYSHIQLSLPNR
jgi:hypothetical protein